MDGAPRCDIATRGMFCRTSADRGRSNAAVARPNRLALLSRVAGAVRAPSQRDRVPL